MPVFLRLLLDMRPATRQLRAVLASASLLAGVPLAVQAQAGPEPGRRLAAVIDGYVREGLKSILGLRAQSLEVERAGAALDAARAKYFPEAALAARYSRSDGGRTIDLPLGDALNPAYQTLNDLLVQQGDTTRTEEILKRLEGRKAPPVQVST